MIHQIYEKKRVNFDNFMNKSLLYIFDLSYLKYFPNSIKRSVEDINLYFDIGIPNLLHHGAQGKNKTK